MWGNWKTWPLSPCTFRRSPSSAIDFSPTGQKERFFPVNRKSPSHRIMVTEALNQEWVLGYAAEVGAEAAGAAGAVLLAASAFAFSSSCLAQAAAVQ